MDELDTTWSVDTWLMYVDPADVRTLVVSDVDEQTARDAYKQTEDALAPDGGQATELRLIHGYEIINIGRWHTE